MRTASASPACAAKPAAATSATLGGDLEAAAGRAGVQHADARLRPPQPLRGHPGETVVLAAGRVAPAVGGRGVRRHDDDGIGAVQRLVHRVRPPRSQRLDGGRQQRMETGDRHPGTEAPEQQEVGTRRGAVRQVADESDTQAVEVAAAVDVVARTFPILLAGPVPRRPQVAAQREGVGEGPHRVLVPTVACVDHADPQAPREIRGDAGVRVAHHDQVGGERLEAGGDSRRVRRRRPRHHHAVRR